MRKNLMAAAPLICFLTCFFTNVSSEDKEIKFGQSADLSGSMKLYSQTIKTGILAYFNYINEKGGVHGKKLTLTSLDDVGIPTKTKENINNLLKNKKINMFLGCTNTRGALSVLPMIQSGKIAMFFLWGSDPKLQNPNLKYIINGPGLLTPQLTAIADYITKTLLLKTAGLFYADSEFNKNAAIQFENLIKERMGHIVSSNSYNRFTFDISGASAKLKATDPRIIICLTTSAPAARLVNQMLEDGHYGSQYIGIDSTLFAKDMLKNRGVKFLVASAVPSPFTTKIAIANQYFEAMQKFFPNETCNVLSFTYFIASAIIVKAMEKSNSEKPEAIIEQIEQMQKIMIDGFEVNFDAQDRHAFGKKISIS
jgi:ABC-type branched-subunit amino acid transport system substrate-binding protein